jgi:hypothetical protein
MAKKYASLFLVAVLLFVVMGFTASDTGSSLVFACDHDNDVVDKAAEGAFTVRIEFQNTGETEGTWSVNIAFEDSSWSWAGTAQILTLQPEEAETLIWNGFVPANASIDSMARLVVYYDDYFKALDWWIHVVSGAELTIQSSTVE